MRFSIKKEDFPKLEMFLFQLNFPCHCKIRVEFMDSYNFYEYETIELDGKLTLVTI